jgi:hypothetical protein
MYELLSTLFDKAGDDEIAPIAYLCEGRLLQTSLGRRPGSVTSASSSRS